MKLKNKVFAYITHGRRLLVFRHLDFPEAGIQVLAGTREESEPPEIAVLREAKEETGLVSLLFGEFLGEYDYPVEERKEIHRRRFYHLRCEGAVEDVWRHDEIDPSDGGKEPIRFELYWIELKGVLPDLAPGHDRMIPELLIRLKEHEPIESVLSTPEVSPPPR